MPYTDYDTRIQKRFSFNLDNNPLVMLIIILLVVYAGIAFVHVGYLFTLTKETAPTYFYNDIIKNIAMPADFGQFIKKPWTLLTHFFYHIHTPIWPLVGSLLWLWSFGFILQDLTGPKKIIPIFIYGGLGAGIITLIAFNAIPSLRTGNSEILFSGASAGVMSVAIATTMISPGFRIFPFIKGGIPLWVLTVFYVLISLAIPPYFPQKIIFVTSGGIMGFLFIYFLRMGYDWSEGMNDFFEWISNLFNPNKPKKGKRIKEHAFYKQDKAPYKKMPNLTQQKIDEILDKINQKGYGTLTDEEIKLLKKAAEDDSFK